MQPQNRTIAVNSIYLYLRTFVSIIVSLYTSRVLLEMLGIEDFGIYNLIGGVVALLAILRNFLVGAIQRYLNIEIGKGDKERESKVLNISKTINFAVIAIMLVLAETVGLWFVCTQLNIPEGKEQITLVVYHFTIATTVVSMLSTPYNALIVAHERMSLFAWITIFEVFAKLGITLILGVFLTRLIAYSGMILVLYVIVLVWYFLYCKKYLVMTPYRYYSPKSNPEYKGILSFSIWIIVGHGASIGRDQGITILFNIFGGVVLNAAMGIVNQISNVYSTLFSNVQTAFMPQIIQSCGTDKDRFSMLLKYCCLASFVLMSFVCLPMIACADFILHVWLGKNIPEYAVVFTQLFMVKILIVSISQAIYQALVAVGRIKEIQIWFVVLSILTLIGSWLILRIGIQPSVAIIFVIVSDAVFFMLRFYYTTRYTEVKASEIIAILYKPVLLILFVLLPLSILLSKQPQTFSMFFLSLLTITILNVAVASISIGKEGRTMILERFKKNNQ